MAYYNMSVLEPEMSGCIITQPDNRIELNIVLPECHNEKTEQDECIAQDKRKYRTRGRAKELDDMISRIPIITIHPWEHALSFHQNEQAFMCKDTGTKPKDTYGKTGMYKQVCSVQSYEKIPACGQGDVPDVDLQTLRFLYGMVLQKWFDDCNENIQMYMKDPKQMLSYNITFYVPDFIRACGISSNSNNEAVHRVIQKIRSYSGLTGIVKEENIARSTYEYYSVMLFIGYDESYNTITISSPYINRIIQKTLYASIRYDKKGNMIRSKSGSVSMHPSHSYRLDAGILKERNKRAAEVAGMIAALIDRSGNNTAHIKFSTIIERYERLKLDIDNATTTYNKNRILRSTFCKAWEFLDKYTDLKKHYKNIQIPDPEDKNTIPTMKTLDRVIEFPHEGRIRNQSKQQSDLDV